MKDFLKNIAIAWAGFKSTYKATQGIIQTICIGAVLTEAWFLPWFFRQEIPVAVTYAGYFAASVASLTALTLMLHYFLKVGQQKPNRKVSKK